MFTSSFISLSGIIVLLFTYLIWWVESARIYVILMRALCTCTAHVILKPKTSIFRHMIPSESLERSQQYTCAVWCMSNIELDTFLICVKSVGGAAMVLSQY